MTLNSVVVARDKHYLDPYVADVLLMHVRTAPPVHCAVTLRPEKTVIRFRQRGFCVTCVRSSAPDKASNSLLRQSTVTTLCLQQLILFLHSI